MASVLCKECGGQTEWEGDVGSQVCVDCGTLEDASQSVLVSTADNRESTFINDLGTTLKSRKGWDLAGQGKEARDRYNGIMMHDFINAVLVGIGHPALRARSIAIFDLAMTRGQHRWGRKSKLLAGAAIVIALREANKADSMRDIAYFLEVSPKAILKVFTATVTLLDLPYTSADAIYHLSTLQAHVIDLLQPASSSCQPSLPTPLHTALRALTPHFSTIYRTATLLCTLLSRLGTLAHLPTQPTACAVYVLALESEFCGSLPCVGELHKVLAARFGMAGVGVAMRYRMIYGIVEDWMQHVPWLKSHETVTRTRNGVRSVRSVVSKRTSVAKGLKDVVQFQEDIWLQKVMKLDKVRLTLVEDGDQENNEEGLTLHKRKAETPLVPTYPLKKPRMRPQAVDQATGFLLAPLASLSGPSKPSLPNSAFATHNSELISYLLSADTTSLILTAAPSRLRILATIRGGGSVVEIPDTELFEEGELESLIRSEEEVRIVKKSLGWVACSASEDVPKELEALQSCAERGQVMESKCSRNRDPTRHGVTVGALARLLEEPLLPVGDQNMIDAVITLGWGDWDAGDSYCNQDVANEDEGFEGSVPTSSSGSTLDDADWYEF